MPKVLARMNFSPIILSIIRFLYTYVQSAILRNSAVYDFFDVTWVVQHGCLLPSFTLFSCIIFIFLLYFYFHQTRFVLWLGRVTQQSDSPGGLLYSSQTIPSKLLVFILATRVPSKSVEYAGSELVHGFVAVSVMIPDPHDKYIPLSSLAASSIWHLERIYLPERDVIIGKLNKAMWKFKNAKLRFCHFLP